MTANASIDPSVFLHEQLAQASPDLMRELLSTFINAGQVTVRDGLVVKGRLFAELVEQQGAADIDESVEAQSGHRPQLED
jgi:hypothetical protein